MPRCYWLVKSEPGAYSWDDLVSEGRTAWDGVRNAQARNNLAHMREGDLVLFYHSVRERRVVGIARVVRESYPDPTSEDPRWVAVDVEPLKPLAEPVGLDAMRADPAFRDAPLLRQSRLSVTRFEKAQFERVLALGRTQLDGRS